LLQGAVVNATTTTVNGVATFSTRRTFICRKSFNYRPSDESGPFLTVNCNKIATGPGPTATTVTSVSISYSTLGWQIGPVAKVTNPASVVNQGTVTSPSLKDPPPLRRSHRATSQMVQ